MKLQASRRDQSRGPDLSRRYDHSRRNDRGRSRDQTRSTSRQRSTSRGRQPQSGACYSQDSKENSTCCNCGGGCHFAYECPSKHRNDSRDSQTKYPQKQQKPQDKQSHKPSKNLKGKKKDHVECFANHISATVAEATNVFLSQPYSEEES